MKKIRVKLTDGRIMDLTTNPFGQVYCADVDEDISTAAELLGAAPCDVRYGMVHPSPDAILAE